MKNFWLYVVRILSLLLFLFVMFRNISVIWIVLYGLTLIAALFFGRFFCGWICPINTCMIATDKIAKKHKLQQRKTPSWISSGWFSWLLFVAFIAFVVTSKVLEKQLLPIPLYFAGIAIILTFFFLPEVFHNAICPFGTLQRLFGRAALFSRRVASKKCTGCKTCVSVCPPKAISMDPVNHKASIDVALCHQCFECESACPTQAIEYRKKTAPVSK